VFKRDRGEFGDHEGGPDEKKKNKVRPPICSRVDGSGQARVGKSSAKASTGKTPETTAQAQKKKIWKNVNKNTPSSNNLRRAVLQDTDTRTGEWRVLGTGEAARTYVFRVPRGVGSSSYSNALKRKIPS